MRLWSLSCPEPGSVLSVCHELLFPLVQECFPVSHGSTFSVQCFRDFLYCCCSPFSSWCPFSKLWKGFSNTSSTLATELRAAPITNTVPAASDRDWIPATEYIFFLLRLITIPHPVLVPVVLQILMLGFNFKETLTEICGNAIQCSKTII